VDNGVQKAPTQAPVELDAPGTTFTQKSLQLRTGPGTVYVVNIDSHSHTFVSTSTAATCRTPCRLTPRPLSC
jgi:hypothetical protein